MLPLIRLLSNETHWWTIPRRRGPDHRNLGQWLSMHNHRNHVYIYIYGIYIYIYISLLHQHELLAVTCFPDSYETPPKSSYALFYCDHTAKGVFPCASVHLGERSLTSLVTFNILQHFNDQEAVPRNRATGHRSPLEQRESTSWSSLSCTKGHDKIEWNIIIISMCYHL